jgi:hypothetical protein
MSTVDASVWVNAFDQCEPGHQVNRQSLGVLQSQALPIMVPNLVLLEVSGGDQGSQRPKRVRAGHTCNTCGGTI